MDTNILAPNPSGRIAAKKVRFYFTASTPPKIFNSYIIDNPFDNRKLITE
jgi:hypothetical protein